MDERRDTLRRLTAAHIKVDHAMKAARGNMPEMLRLLRIRRGLRLMMEPIATTLHK